MRLRSLRRREWIVSGELGFKEEGRKERWEGELRRSLLPSFPSTPPRPAATRGERELVGTYDWGKMCSKKIVLLKFQAV